MNIDILEHRGKFFEILGTSASSQIGVMTLQPGEDSGAEEQHFGDQVVYVVAGSVEIEIEHTRSLLRAGEAVIVPAQAQHHIQNTSDEEVFMFFVYAPPSY